MAGNQIIVNQTTKFKLLEFVFNKNSGEKEVG